LSEDPKVVFDARRIYEITERSDIDPHEDLRPGLGKSDKLGEDWGDGFFVQEEPVAVLRDKSGAIIRTTPLSEVPFLNWNRDEDEEPPVEGRARTNPVPMNAADRSKLVAILAQRLFRWYAQQPRSLLTFNPLYDGIPRAPSGSPEHLQPVPGTKLYPATPGEVLEWLKNDVIAPRIRVINKKKNLKGWTADAADYAVRISREPN
jgi:hypothetical protein